MTKEKSNMIEETMKMLNEKHHNDSVVYGSDMAKKIESIDTNCYSLNNIFGCGGLPRGRTVEIYGEASSGKSALSMYIVAQVQKRGGKALLIDAEQAFSQEYAKKMGVDTDNLIVSQCFSGEEGLDIVEKMVATGQFDIIVIDSVAALVTEKELEGENTDVTIALQAKLMSRHLRVITPVAAKTKTCLVYINQTRSNIVTFGYGKKTSTPGGKAMRFYASVILEVKAVGKIKDKKDQVVGNHLKIYAEKNKVGLPFRYAEIDLYFEKGIDVIGDILNIATTQGIITKTGNSYSYEEIKLASNRNDAITYLSDHPEVVKEIKKKLKS